VMTSLYKQQSAKAKATYLSVVNNKLKKEMGSEGVVVDFLKRCEPSGDAAYGELKALLGRLHDPATRRQARVFLAALRGHSSDDGGDLFFRRYGFAIRELDLRQSVPFFHHAGASSAGQYTVLYTVCRLSCSLINDHLSAVRACMNKLATSLLPSSSFFFEGEYILKGLNSGITNTPSTFRKAPENKQNTAKYMQSSRKHAEIRTPTCCRRQPASEQVHLPWICRNSHCLPPHGQRRIISAERPSTKVEPTSPRRRKRKRRSAATNCQTTGDRKDKPPPPTEMLTNKATDSPKLSFTPAIILNRYRLIKLRRYI
jgi:hypothetical protein